MSFFDDFTSTAQTAPVFWTREVNPHIIVARTTPFDPATGGAQPFCLDDFDCEKTVLQAADGREHILFRHPFVTIQLAIYGTSVLDGPIRVVFEVDGLTNVRNAAASLHNLIKLRAGILIRSCRDWSQSELHLRDYLIALDGSLNRASYREIAWVIYGPGRVREAWTGDSRFLKDRIRRAVERGHALMNGGYQKLLW